MTLDRNKFFTKLRKAPERPSTSYGDLLLSGYRELFPNKKMTIREPQLSLKKVNLIQNLEAHVEKKKKIKVPGAEVTLKDPEQNPQEILIEPTADSFQYLDKDKETKVIFFLEESKFQSEQEKSELILQNMIRAMKVESIGYQVVSVKEVSESLKKEFLSELFSVEAKILVSFGAASSNIILGKKERLSNSHGKFFPISISKKDGSRKDFELIPIFHPDYLVINPNMKKTAWVDLQKVMKKLGIES